MTLWTAMLVASIVCVALKTVGYLVPPKWVEAPRPMRIADLLTVALLAALVAVQTLGAGQEIVVDARIPAVLVFWVTGIGIYIVWNLSTLAGALLVAAGLLLLRAPFLVVVAAAALTAALLRLWGWAA